MLITDDIYPFSPSAGAGVAIFFSLCYNIAEILSRDGTVMSYITLPYAKSAVDACINENNLMGTLMPNEVKRELVM